WAGRQRVVGYGQPAEQAGRVLNIDGLDFGVDWDGGGTWAGDVVVVVEVEVR
ncbi:unnamed protein product, partial [Linum tenue]